MKMLTSLFMLLFVLFIGSIAIVMNAAGIVPQPALAQAQVLETPSLSVLAQQCRRVSDYYMQCDGEVKNLTSTPIQHVKALVSYYDKQRTFVTSDGALIAFNPLMPGQRSPFKILTPYHPHFSQFGISFTTLWGTPIAAQEQATPTPAPQHRKAPKKGRVS